MSNEIKDKLKVIKTSSREGPENALLETDILEEFISIKNNKNAIGYECLKKILYDNSECSCGEYKYGEYSEEEVDKLVQKLNHKNSINNISILSFFDIK